MVAAMSFDKPAAPRIPNHSEGELGPFCKLLDGDAVSLDIPQASFIRS